MLHLLREDPRYFRIGEGPFGHRLWYAVTRTFVTTTDSHHMTFNFAEWKCGRDKHLEPLLPGRSNLAGQHREISRTVWHRYLSNVLKEFWPDVKRHFQKKKD